MIVADLSPALLAYPQVLPGSTALLLTSVLGGGTAIEVLSLKDGSRKVVGRGGTAARYTPQWLSCLPERRHFVRCSLRRSPP